MLFPPTGAAQGTVLASGCPVSLRDGGLMLERVFAAFPGLPSQSRPKQSVHQEVFDPVSGAGRG